MGDESTLFPASETTPGQAQSRRAYKEILASLTNYEWWQDYLELTERGWDWRKAVYIAWAASPAKDRQPATQEELATHVLGLASDRVIRKWRKDQPELDAEIAHMQAAPLLRHRRDVFQALVTSATDPDPKSHPDRKLALEMMGDYKPRQINQVEGGEKPVRIEDESLNDEQRAERIAAIFDRARARRAGQAAE